MYEYNKVFELWCKSLKRENHKAHPCPMTAITWMETTPDGREVVKKLYTELTEEAKNE